MTNDEREALIEKAARAIHAARWGTAVDWGLASERARARYRVEVEAVFAVFEEATAPTDEREVTEGALWGVVERLSLPLTGVEVQALAESVARRTAVQEPQAEPTDAQVCERCGCVDGEHLGGCSALAEPTEVDADPDTAFELGRVAGYDEAMREVQAEPTRILLTHPHDGHGENDTCMDCVQVEPTDVQVNAFVTVINAVGVVLDRRTVKAGLRAAFQEGETR